ncbi:MAG: hypothetical protein LBF91_08720 [Azoarcus sp.]|jgi:hypothetical protein|nr:hypothetical protein [Azoarcus sp.]
MKAWIRREVARGLQGLIALRLPGAPGEDTVGMTLDIWLAAIAPRAAGWDESGDAGRVRAAFSSLFAMCRQWPAPAQLLEAMPAPRPPVLLPPRKFSDAERAKNRARIAALMERFFKHHRMKS